MYIYVYIYMYIYDLKIQYLKPNYLHYRVFVNSLGAQGSISGLGIPKTQKWYLMPTCLTLRIIGYGLRVRGAIQRKEQWLP